MIKCVVLCGGSGSRLWPLSRSNFPKQFIKIAENEDLLKNTFQRLKKIDPLQINENNEPLIVTGRRYIPFVKNSLKGESYKILSEPDQRNTAPAICVAAIVAYKEDKDSVVAIFPSDQEMALGERLNRSIVEAIDIANEKFIVSLGIVPEFPETGFGYIRKGEKLNVGNKICKFIEKPKYEVAKKMVESKEYLWNSGIFIAKSEIIIDEFKLYRPDILQCVKDSLKEDENGVYYLGESYLTNEAISFDYAIMEKTARAAVVTTECDWSDLGSWESLYKTRAKDEDDNVIFGDVIPIETERSFIYSSERLISSIGVKDLVIVDTPDALLVARKDKSQDVKKVFNCLKEKHRKEADTPSVVYRPWGSYESLFTGSRFQVKRIIVLPGEELSLQKHYHRAEHWIVVSGTAEVVVGQKSFVLTENQSTFIPLGEIHQLRNPGKITLIVIEVQSGSYLGEDDIVRLTDKYNRV